MEHVVGTFLVLVSAGLFWYAKHWKNKYEKSLKLDTKEVMDEISSKAQKYVEDTPLQQRIDANNAKLSAIADREYKTGKKE